MFSHTFINIALKPEENTPQTEASPLDIPAANAPTGLILILIVILPFALGYFLSYLFRSTNAIIAPQLISEIGLDASDLGFLTAMYFLTFSLFQLPLGILLDRYGPRRVQTFLLFFAALGAFLFAHSDTIEGLAASRGLIGLGVAGCLMASIKASTLWFDEKYWPAINGTFLAAGGLGAVAATTPLEIALTYIDWRTIFIVLAALTIVVALLIFSIVPEKKKSNSFPTLKKQVLELGIIYRNSEFWKCAPLISASLGTNMAIQGLWAGPWLKDIAEFDRDIVANYLLWLAIALSVGSLATGVIASWLERFGLSLAKFFGLSTILFIGCQIIITFEIIPGSIGPWIIFGLFANAAMLAVAHLTRYFNRDLSGRVITGVNVFVFGSVFLSQYLIGKILSIFPINENGEYASEAYFAAFGAVILVQSITFIWFILPIQRS